MQGSKCIIPKIDPNSEAMSYLGDGQDSVNTTICKTRYRSPIWERKETGIWKVIFQSPDMDSKLLNNSFEKNLISEVAAQGDALRPQAQLQTILKQKTVAEPESETSMHTQKLPSAGKIAGKMKWSLRLHLYIYPSSISD